MANPLVEMAIKSVKDQVEKKLAGLHDREGHPLVPQLLQHVQEFETQFRAVADVIPADQWQSILNTAIDLFNQKILHGQLTETQIAALKKALQSGAHILLLGEQFVAEVASQAESEPDDKKKSAKK